MKDLIALAESPATPPLTGLPDDALEFSFGSGTGENSLGTGTRSSDIRTNPNTIVGFISRAFQGGRHYTVLSFSDLRLSFSCDASDVLVREKDAALGTLPHFRVGSWSYESNEFCLTCKNIFWSFEKALLTFPDGANFKIRHGDGCLLSKDLNHYLLAKGSRAKKLTLALILYARFFRASM
jgi:hypothetical protein